MSFTSLIGNEHIKTWLGRALGAGRMPGALIFAGPEGVGKKAFAVELAKALNCPNANASLEACGKCSACSRISVNEFSDVRVISPDGQFIKIDQVREIVGQIYYRPFEGRCRVYIFDSAERFREQAANALLKTLEEPPSTSMIILVTASPDALLPTIRSRAVCLRFTPLAEEELISYLTKNYPRPPIETRLAARLSGGSIGKAISIDLSVYKEARKECLELLELLMRKKSRLRLIKAAEYFGKKEREEFESRLEMLLILLRDLLCMRLKLKDEVVNFDLSDRLEDLSASSDPNLIKTVADHFASVQKNLIRNINRQLALEAGFLQICGNNS